MNQRTSKRITQIFLLSLLLFAGTLPAADKPSFSFSIVPQMGSQQIQEMWTPILQKLTQITGYKFRLKLHVNVREFEKTLIKGEIDFAYMNPYHLILTRQTDAYIPIVRDSATDLVGILVVKETSDIESIEQLNGKNIAFPSPNAFGASLYMRALLKTKEKINFKSVYSKTHGNVYRNVIFSRAAAGGGVFRTFYSESEAIQEHLRIIYKTPGVAPHPLAAHPKVSKQVRDKILQGFLTLAADKANNKILKNIKFTQPVEANFKRDYQPLLDLKLEHFAETSHLQE